jgi:hypothetical protein
MTVPEEPTRVEAEFMYSLLDYETWNLYWGDEWIGQVQTNSLDRQVTLILQEIGVDPYQLGRIGNYARWVTWLRSHQRPRTTHKY